MAYFAVVVLTLLLFANGVYRRCRDGLPVDHEYLSRIFIDAFGLGTALVGAVISVWLTYAVAVRGGTIEGSLPQGVTVDSVLGLMIVGAWMTAISTFTAYRDRVYPYKRVGGRTQGASAPDASRPLDLRPEDSPE